MLVARRPSQMPVRNPMGPPLMQGHGTREANQNDRRGGCLVSITASIDFSPRPSAAEGLRPPLLAGRPGRSTAARSAASRAWVGSGLVGRRGRWWVGGIERGLEPGPVGLALDDEVVGGVLESVDGALREQHIVEHREPLGGVAIAGNDHRGPARALEEELIDVLALLLGHGLEREVVDHDQVDAGEGDHLGVAGVVETTLPERAEHGVGAHEADVVAVAAGDVAEGLRHERLADTDGPEDHHVTMGLEESQAHKLGEHALVEGDLGGFVPQLQAHRGIEPGVAGAVVGGGAVATRDFVGEHEQEQVVERHFLLVGKYEPLGQRVEDASELEALERGDELGVDCGGGHQTPSFLLGVRVSKCASDRANRGSGSCTSLPSWLVGEAGLAAALSMRVMRATSTTSNARALWQTASTRPSLYLSQRRRSAYAARIRAHGSGPPSNRSA